MCWFPFNQIRNCDLLKIGRFACVEWERLQVHCLDCATVSVPVYCIDCIRAEFNSWSKIKMKESKEKCQRKLFALNVYGFSHWNCWILSSVFLYSTACSFSFGRSSFQYHYKFYSFFLSTTPHCRAHLYSLPSPFTANYSTLTGSFKQDLHPQNRASTCSVYSIPI